MCVGRVMWGQVTECLRVCVCPPKGAKLDNEDLLRLLFPLFNWLRLRVLLLNHAFVNVANQASQLSLESPGLTPLSAGIRHGPMPSEHLPAWWRPEL